MYKIIRNGHEIFETESLGIARRMIRNSSDSIKYTTDALESFVSSGGKVFSHPLITTMQNNEFVEDSRNIRRGQFGHQLNRYNRKKKLERESRLTGIGKSCLQETQIRYQCPSCHGEALGFAKMPEPFCAQCTDDDLPVQMYKIDVIQPEKK